jgi:hypothetical protein
MHRACFAAACLAALPALPAQNPFATRVVSFDDKGQAGGGIFNPNHLLGRPDGSVHSLGIGGNAVLGFDVVLCDGPGADLIVTENPFYSGPPAHTFAEVAYVEVSSNGADFARVPSFYFGPLVQPGPYGVIDPASYEGLAGAIPRGAGPDPQDLVGAGGDAIDLADLRDDPLVRRGAVDLQAIRFVRLVDVRSGIDADARRRPIFDPGGGSADIDGVTVIHHQGNRTPRGPSVDVRMPADGSLEIELADPDGLTDLDPQSLSLALWGIPVPFADLLPLLRVTQLSATSVTLKLAGTLPPGFLLRVGVSLKDRAGNRSGDARSRAVN